MTIAMSGRPSVALSSGGARGVRKGGVVFSSTGPRLGPSRASRTGRILTVGLSPAWQHVLIFDRLDTGDVNRARQSHYLASGKVLNAARAVARLGASGCALTISGGALGAALRAALDDEAIEHDGVVTQSASRTSSDLRGPELVEALHARPTHAGEVHRFDPPTQDVVNPIGCGDTLAGGIAVGLADDRRMVEAIRLGIGCAVANLVTLLQGDIRREDALKYAAEVKYTRVE